jgi:hypothetical protein
MKIKSLFTSFSSFLYLFILILFWGIIFLPKYSYNPFCWDDLHLIRVYSSQELKLILTSSVDPDGIETISYRPIAGLLWHFQATVFGENTMYHRIFGLFLLFSLLNILILILKQLSVPKIQIWFTLGLLVFSKIFITLAIWATLYQIVLSYIFILLSVFFIIKAGRSQFLINTFFVIIFFIASLLTREEGYVLPILLLLIIKFTDIISNKKNGYIIFGLLILIIVIHVFHNNSLVTSTYQEGSGLLHLLKRFWAYKGTTAYFIVSTILPGGIFSHGLIDNLLKYLWIFILLVFSWKFISNGDYKKIFLYASAIIICSLPAFHTPRFFGIFLPSIVAYSIISYIIFSYFNWHSLHRQFFLIIVIILPILAGYSRSLSITRTFEPNSVHILYYDSKFIYGGYGKVTIPKNRRLEKEQQLKQLGINSEFNLDSLLLIHHKGNNNINKNIKFPDYKVTDP